MITPVFYLLALLAIVLASRDAIGGETLAAASSW